MIDSTTYKLNDCNYHKIETIKKRIVIGNSFSFDMGHYEGWKLRINGKYKNTAMFTITRDGNIYQHFSTKYYSNFIDKLDIDETIISIVLENEGWLIKDLNNKNKYITTNGNIYKRVKNIFEKKWRDNNFWVPYTKKQFEATLALVPNLCEEENIPLNVVSSNTLISDAKNFSGIMYRSNFDKNMTDVNPSWDFNDFKNKLELKNIDHD